LPRASRNPESGYSDPAAAGTQNTNFTDAELKQFVDAQDGINDIRDEYMEKIESADSQQQAQGLQQEANNEMVEIIEDAGLDIPTYNSIATAYNSEPKVRNRVDALM
jgi:GTP1/Obg family GTP-binding protein